MVPESFPPRFEEDPAPTGPDREGQLLLALDGFDGPIDLLLALAREQKVDLTRLSILQLADQYLVFVAEARRVRLELAADYLVMAAWLAYLKSRLLLPEPDEQEPSGEEMAQALAYQLQRLEAMQQAGERMMSRPRLGRDVWARGAPEGIRVVARSIYEVSLYDLLKAYADHKRRQEFRTWRPPPLELFSLEEAVERLSQVVGRIPDWTLLSSFVPGGMASTLTSRSAMASTFLASLQLAKDGTLELRQEGSFGPIFVRRSQAEV